MKTGLISPSYSQGFAKSAWESANPQLWRGLVGAWMPGLGNSGDTLFDWSGYGHHGIFGGTRGSEYPEWVMKPGGYAIESPGVRNGPVGHIAIGNWVISTGRITIVIKVQRTEDSPSDARIVSRSIGAGSTEHDWMLGNISLTSFRTRLKITGTVYTDVTPSLWTETDKTRFVAARFDGTNVEHLHFRADAGDDVLPMNIVQYAHAGDLVSTDVANYAIEIGRNPGNTPYGSWPGFIYFVYIYDRALLDSEIMDLYTDNYAPFRLRDRTFSNPILNPNSSIDLYGKGHRFFATSWHPETWSYRIG